MYIVESSLISPKFDVPEMIISGTVLTAHAEPERSTFEGSMLPETLHVSRSVD